jgi:hypothetical protein
VREKEDIRLVTTVYIGTYNNVYEVVEERYRTLLLSFIRGRKDVELLLNDQKKKTIDTKPLHYTLYPFLNMCYQ